MFCCGNGLPITTVTNALIIQYIIEASLDCTMIIILSTLLAGV